MKKEPFYNQIEKWIIIVMMICMIALTFFTVCSRFFFAYTLSWAEQLERLMMIWMFFAGISWAGKLDFHYKVTAVTMLFKKHPKMAAAILAFGDIIMIAFGIYMAIQIGKVTTTMMRTGPVLASLPFIPKWIQYLPGVLGMIGLSARTLQRMAGAQKQAKTTVAL